MRFSEQWLRRWISPPVDTHGLANQLTMAGLEVDSVTPAAAEFKGVVVGDVLSVTGHPDAKRLHCCQVNVGEEEPLGIVCGASNVREGLKVAVAVVGAVLPGNFKIKPVKLRGVASSGMICSAKELELSDADDGGILELPADAPVGKALVDYMQLDDHIIDIELTPNRADCLSIQGVARDVAVINQLAFKPKTIAPVMSQIEDSVSIHLNAPKQCPRYVGRVIRDIDSKAQTPIWMRECLRRSGLRCIHPVVDVTNYVMLELGQPMHAFDLTKLQGAINVRLAKAEETLTLLDGAEVTLDKETLVIADAAKPQAIAGVMGGADSGVTESTQHIFLESAYFDPIELSLTARRYGMQTDSSYRFARGVDFNLQDIAIERVTRLLLDVVGGTPGPVIIEEMDEQLPSVTTVLLRRHRIKQLLGISLEDTEVEHMLSSLGMELVNDPQGWQVTPPSFRFDITIEADLIEEVARIYGYQHIPSQQMQLPMVVPRASDATLPASRMAQLLVDLGYCEAITYSFIDPEFQRMIDPDRQAITIDNPISADMSVMRSSLWPGLLQAAQHNHNRQIERVRLFETGLCFWEQGQQDWQQVAMLGGVVSGDVLPQQWGTSSRAADFFDVKGDIESLLNLTGQAQQFQWQTSDHQALHPGQQASLFYQGANIGYLGALHPRLLQQLGLTGAVFVFEFKLAPLEQAKLVQFQSLSKFPAVRRDIAVTVAKDVAAAEIKHCIRQISGENLISIAIFDIYQGEKVAKGQKSVALGLTFQASSRTLTDTEINDIIANILKTLDNKFHAKLRV